jgi:hypothetical protein
MNPGFGLSEFVTIGDISTVEIAGGGSYPRSRFNSCGSARNKAEGVMATRGQLALELLMAGCIAYYDDYRKISRNLRCGFSRETILEMPELAR